MILHKLPLELQEDVRKYLSREKTANVLTLEEEIEIFAEELKNYFSREELEKVAREVKFVKRKGKLEAWHFLFLCSFIGIDVANNTLSTLCSKIGAKFKVIVSNQAIDQRFTEKCVEFMNIDVCSGKDNDCSYGKSIYLQPYFKMVKNHIAKINK